MTAPSCVDSSQLFLPDTQANFISPARNILCVEQKYEYLNEVSNGILASKGKIASKKRNKMCCMQGCNCFKESKWDGAVCQHEKRSWSSWMSYSLLCVSTCHHCRFSFNGRSAHNSIGILAMMTLFIIDEAIEEEEELLSRHISINAIQARCTLNFKWGTDQRHA